MNVTDIVLRFRMRQNGEKIRFYPFWVLDRPMLVKIKNGDLLVIPAGFATDLSSVPRVLWPLFPPFGNFLVAAITHDYMYHVDYKSDTLGRKQARRLADETMLYLSNKYNGGGFLKKMDNYARYVAVRVFGNNIYRKSENVI